MKSTRNTYTFLPDALVRRIRGLELTVRRPMDGMRQSQHRSLALGSSVEFEAYREYAPGDPMQRIDWSVFARSDRLVIRQSHEEVNARAYVLLDVSRSMQFQGDGPMTKMAYACYLAAGIMYMLVHQGDSVSLLTFDRSLRRVFPLTNSAAGLKPLLQHLETIEPSESGDIVSALTEAVGAIRGRTFMIVLSDLLQDPGDVLRALHHFQHEGKDVTVFHILDPAEMHLPMHGLVDVHDMESEAHMTLDLDDVREVYMQQVRTYLDEIRNGCSRLRCDYILADTRAPHHMTLRRRSAAR